MPYNFMQAYNPYSYYPQPQSGMLWVSNEQEAYSYPVAPNNAVSLWDSSRPTVYVKQADASGKPTVKILDYTERQQNTPASHSAPSDSNNTSYALKSDIDAVASEIEAIKGEFKTLKKEIRKRAIDEDDT